MSDAILCRAKVQLAPTVTGEMLFMPAGRHEIMPFSGGIGNKPICIMVDALSAGEIEHQRQELNAKGKPAYFDFDHEDRGASFWPKAFIWRDGEGIIAKGDWTTRGKSSVEGKEYRYFSPVFYVDNKHADPARIQCRASARANMGALINDPAFHEISPLWAKNAGDGEADNNQNGDNNKMNEQELAALRAKQAELEGKVKALEEKGETGDNYDALKAEMYRAQSEVELAEVQARNDKLQAQLKARATDDAKAVVKAAVMRGAIEPRNIKLQDKLIANAVADPSQLEIIKAMKGEMSILEGRVIGSGSGVRFVNEDPARVFAKMAEIMSHQGKVTGSKAQKYEERGKLSLEFASIYAAEFRGDQGNRMLSFPVSDLAIQAADVTDANYGTIAGTLVSQRILEFLKFAFPAITSFTTDFSSEPATYGQTVMTRTANLPTVVTYNTSTGWPDSVAGTADVPCSIDSHKGVQITINEQLMGSTLRRLFDEQAAPAAYALGKAIMDDLYSNITDANFTHNRVATVANFNRGTVVDVGADLNLQGVPNYPGARTMLLYSTFFAALQKDSTLMQLAAFQRPDLITAPQSGAAYGINVSNFMIYDAPNLPTNNGNINGFAGSKSALLLVTRLPNDYTTALPGASYGSVQTVTEPDIGISVMLVQYVNHQLATATSRIAMMWGTNPGQGNAGELIKSNTGSGSSH